MRKARYTSTTLATPIPIAMSAQLSCKSTQLSQTCWRRKLWIFLIENLVLFFTEIKTEINELSLSISGKEEIVIVGILASFLSTTALMQVGRSFGLQQTPHHQHIQKRVHNWQQNMAQFILHNCE